MCKKTKKLKSQLIWIIVIKLIAQVTNSMNAIFSRKKQWNNGVINAKNS